MPDLYPLRFRPLFRRYLWGGRRLQSVLRKPLPAGDDYAESWEIVDRGPDQSVVAAGPLKGHTLHDLVANFGESLLGRHHPQPQFPLLFKFLDAHRDLSVQVHPDDQQAAQLEPPDLGKTEAWVILAAEPGSRLYAGLKRGFDRAAFQRELVRGTAELCLNAIRPHVGDCVFIPAGTVHALGAGLVVAEIQQASDTTFRLYDWNRTGPDGKPRQLHIEQGLAVTNFELGPVAPQSPRATENPVAQRLVACDKFCLDRWQTTQPDTLGGDDRCHIVAVIQGEVRVAGDAAGQPLKVGDTLLVPASAGSVTITPEAEVVLLDMYLP